MNELDIELMTACDKLRIIVRNQQAEKDYAEAWRKMSQTSSTQRRLKNEANARNVSVTISFNKR